MYTQPTQFPVTIELGELNGANGFKVNGISAGDRSGQFVTSIGDINIDDFNDFLVTAYWADTNGSKSGQSYVVFGGASVGASGTLELSNLNGVNGFKLNGIAAGDYSGISAASAGDLNADGVKDLIVGAYGADPNGVDSGQSYVVFGGVSVGSAGVIELSSLNGFNGFKINGIASGDFSGISVSAAGDINGDGTDDLLIGARYADPNGLDSGQSYVVFGGASVGASGTLELSNLNGVNGFKLNGIAAGDKSGISISSVGDINADSVNDIIIGAFKAAVNGPDSGQSYVIFGGSCVGAIGSVELSSLDGSSGFRLNGIAGGDLSGISVSSGGDVNIDGINDLVIGAAFADPNGADSGQSYVIFGGTSIGSSGTLELSNLNGTNGFKINGITVGDQSGFSVSQTGDINGDGIGDLIIGAYGADSNNPDSGQSYVVYGGNNIGSMGTLELSDLNGVNGFQTNGIGTGDQSGRSVSQAGDINGDGVADLVIGAWKAAPNGAASGQSYVVFGSPVPQHIQNTIVIKQNERLTLTVDNLNSTYVNGQFQSLYPTIYYSVVNVQQADFEYAANPGIAISGFTQQDVLNQAVNFVHNGADLPPSYDIIAHPKQGSIWGSSIPAAITFFAAPKLLKNTLSLTEDETITFTDANIKATDTDNNDGDLLFLISSLQHGQFEFKNQPGQAIQSFIQQQIALGNVVFVSDGGEQPPSYRVAVSDGLITTNPEFADVVYFTVNDEPELNNNRFLVKPKGKTLISSNMLQATDEESKDADLIFKVFNATSGHFERFAQPGLAITQFEQRDIINNNILFSTDSNVLPSFVVTVSDGQTQSNPQIATVEWDNNNNQGSLVVSTKSNTVRNAIIGSTISGFVGLLFLAIKIHVKRKSDKQMAKALEGDTESAAGQRAQYFKEVVSPVAKKIFSKLSIKNFFGISDKKLGEFLDAVARLVEECQARGVPVNDLGSMEPAKATGLINEIAKQTKQVLAPTSSITGTVMNFFTRQITPQQLEDASVMIASFVKTAWDSTVSRERSYSQAQGVEMVTLSDSSTNPIFGGDAGVGVGAAASALSKPSEQDDFTVLLAGFKEEFTAKLEESNQQILAENAELKERIEQLEGKQSLPPPLAPRI